MAAKKKARKAARKRSPAKATPPGDLWVDDGLTAEQERFVNELCADPERNATQATYRAYPNQNHKSAKVTGYRNLQNPLVLKAIRRRLAPAIRRARTSIEEVTKQIGDGMHWDVADVLDENGAFLPVKDWPVEARRQLVSLDVEELNLAKGTDPIGRVLKARFTNRTDFITLGAKMNKMLTDRVEVDVVDHRAERLAAARARVTH